MENPFQPLCEKKCSNVKYCTTCPDKPIGPTSPSITTPRPLPPPGTFPPAPPPQGAFIISPPAPPSSTIENQAVIINAKDATI